MTMTQAVRLDQTEKLSRITLNRPNALNAMNVALLEQLVDALERSRDARVVILSGEGRAFCAGEDLRETLAPRTGEVDELHHAFELLQSTTRLITSMPGCVIAAIQGYAIGGGAELGLAADIVIVHPETKLRFPEVSIGHAVTGGITARLAATIGLIRAKDLLLTSRFFDGKEALHMGLISELSDKPLQRAEELAAELAEMPRRSMAATKAGIELATIPHLEAVLRAEIDSAVYCFIDDEAKAIHDKFQVRRADAGATR
jgi:2-(1,2-epoxy-1,2-dihydrophenyl)acetyl-CoA isomerase